VPVPASEKLTIETPEHIALEFPLASAGSRFLAIAIDTLIQFGALFVLGLIAALTTSAFSAAATWVIAILLLLGFVLYYGYFACFEGLWSGQTPGKRAIRLRVITTSGRPITFYDSLLRNLLRIVDQVPGFYAVGLVSVFLTERNQRLGDLAADTVVVAEQPIAQGHVPRRTRPGAVHRGAARLSAEELAVIETFLSRREEVPYDVRRETASAIAARVRRQLNMPADDTVRDEALLEEVAAEARGGWR
jgi:uncharacterized RDD family membrane protein YckC